MTLRKYYLFHALNYRTDSCLSRTIGTKHETFCVSLQPVRAYPKQTLSSCTSTMSRSSPLRRTCSCRSSLTGHSAIIFRSDLVRCKKNKRPKDVLKLPLPAARVGPLEITPYETRVLVLPVMSIVSNSRLPRCEFVGLTAGLCESRASTSFSLVRSRPEATGKALSRDSSVRRSAAKSCNHCPTTI